MIKKYLLTIAIAFIITGFAIPYAFQQGQLYHFKKQNLLGAFLIAMPFNEKYAGVEVEDKKPKSDYYLLSYILFFDWLVNMDQSASETAIGEFLRKLNAVLTPQSELLSYEQKQNVNSNLWQCKLLDNKEEYNIPNPKQLLARYNQSSFAGKLAVNYTAEQAEQAWQNLSCDPSLLEAAK